MDILLNLFVRSLTPYMYTGTIQIDHPFTVPCTLAFTAVGRLITGPSLACVSTLYAHAFIQKWAEETAKGSSKLDYTGP